MLKDLIIVGASGFGREVAWLVERINNRRSEWNILGFLDDNEELVGTSIGGYPVLGGCSSAVEYQDACFVCAVGNSKVRKKLVEKLGKVRFATLIDPSVMMSERVTIGEGSIICAGNIITVDVAIGKHTIVNLDCTIGHDVVIEDYVTLYPSVNVSGNSHVGMCCELGTGMQIIQGKTIGECSIIGAGAVVVKDIPANCTAVGSPAKPIKYTA